MVQLDKVDRQILKILQRDNQLTNVALAARIKLSPPTCLKRVRRLREQKVISADVSIVEPQLVGKSLFVFIDVVLERQGEQLQQAFETKMERADEVMQCYMVSGDTDFIVVAQLADMDAYQQFVRRTLTSDSNVRNFRSLFAMSRSKFRTAITLEER